MVPLSTMTAGERIVCWLMVLLFHIIWSVCMVYHKYVAPPEIPVHFTVRQPKFTKGPGYVSDLAPEAHLQERRGSPFADLDIRGHASEGKE